MSETTKPVSPFHRLNAINVNNHTEKKGEGRNALTYLSWAWAWAKVKDAYPDSYYTVYENADGWNYFTDGRTCWVKTGVTIVDGDKAAEMVESLPVMNYQNKSIPLKEVTSMDVNKAIQRSLTKACARHGLGLYIYAGEDLPESEAASLVNVQELDKVIKTHCRGMNAEQKKAVAETIKTISGGTANYMQITDQAILQELMQHFKPKEE